MRWILELSLKFRLLVVALAAGGAFVGVAQLRTMPIDVLPEFSPVHVEIQTEALGLSAEEVAQLITVPLEQDLLNGVAWIDTLQSESVPGLSSIVMTFRPGTDLYKARQMVGERLTQAFALPHVSKPPTMMQPMSSTSRVMIVGLSSSAVSPIDLSVLARWTVAPRLMGVPGVSNVAIWGQRDRQLQVLVDPRQLRTQKVSLLQVMETTGNAMWVSSLSWVEASTPGTGGFIETGNQRLGIRHIFPIASASDLARVPVEGTGFRLGDVATVVEDHQPLIGDAVGRAPAELLLVVEKLPGANTLAVTEGVESALAALQPGMPGVEINSSVYRPATYVAQAIGNVSRALIVACVLTALVLGLLLVQWRSVLISLVAIPLALLVGVLALASMGTTLNMLIVAGLAAAAAVVVHDVILSIDAVARRLQERRPEDQWRSKASIVLDAAMEGRNPLVYATLTMLLVLVPVFFVGGGAGAFFTPVALAYAVAVLASMLVALTVTPTLCVLLLQPASGQRPVARHLQWLQRVYEAALRPVLRHPIPVLAIGALVGLAGLIALPLLPASLTPTFREPNVLVHLDAAPGTSASEMNRIASRVGDELRGIPGVRNVGAHIGRAVLGDKVNQVNSSDMWLSIDPSAPYDATLAAVADVVAGYPGIGHSVRSYLQEKTATLTPESDNALTVRVYGNSFDQLRNSANDVRRAISGVKGISGAQVVLPTEQPTLNIQVDLAAAQQFGLKPGDVRRQAATLVSGTQVGSLFDAQKVFDVVVWGIPEIRGSVEDVRNLLLDNPAGRTVTLGEVASAQVALAPAVIRHDSARSYLDVRAEVAGRSLDAVASDVEQRVQGVKFPLEYHAEVLTTYAQRQAAQYRLIGLTIAVLVGMYLLLQAAFTSWRLGALCVAALVAALSGGVLMAHVSGTGLSLGALIGLLVVFGPAVRAGIAQIARYQSLGASEHPLARENTAPLVAPLVATALATVLAFLPFVAIGDVAGAEILRAAAGVIVGGVLAMLLVTLFVIPAFFQYFAVRAAATAPESAAAASSAAPVAPVEVPVAAGAAAN